MKHPKIYWSLCLMSTPPALRASPSSHEGEEVTLTLVYWSLRSKSYKNLIQNLSCFEILVLLPALPFVI